MYAIEQKVVGYNNVNLEVSLVRQPTRGGDTEFDILASALVNYQSTLLQRIQDEEEEDLKTSFLEGAKTCNELLCRVLTQGFIELLDRIDEPTEETEVSH